VRAQRGSAVALEVASVAGNGVMMPWASAAEPAAVKRKKMIKLPRKNTRRERALAAQAGVRMTIHYIAWLDFDRIALKAVCHPRDHNWGDLRRSNFKVFADGVGVPVLRVM